MPKSHRTTPKPDVCRPVIVIPGANRDTKNGVAARERHFAGTLNVTGKVVRVVGKGLRRRRQSVLLYAALVKQIGIEIKPAAIDFVGHAADAQTSMPLPGW